MTVTINGTTGIAGTNGSAGTPAVQGEDTNTGIFFPAADTVAVATAGAERLRVDSSGNVGIGTAAPAAKIESVQTTSGASGWFMAGQFAAANYPMIRFAATTPDKYSSIGNNADGGFQFFINGSSGALGTQAMTLQPNGNLLLGTTSDGFSAKQHVVSSLNCIAAKTTASADSYEAFVGSRNGNAGKVATWWYSDSVQVGSISVTSSATAYNTSSDYRLKENVTPMQNALDTVAQLNPVTYTWKADGSAGQGFIAHELQAVVPDCVTGEKDAVDAEGNPQYQGVDTSFLVATLVAAIKEQQATITDLTARIAILEAQ